MQGFWERYNEALAERPDEIVLADPTRSYTRRELDDAAGAYAEGLRREGTADNFVMIVGKRDAAAYVAMLGVWKAGRAFVACEESLPQERIDFIRRDVCNLRGSSLHSAVPLPLPTPTNSRPYFAVYTSGTTGTPKRIVHGERTIDWNCHSFEYKDTRVFRQGERVAVISPISTVAAVIMFTDCLYVGACLFVTPVEALASPEEMIECFDRHHVTQSFVTPSLARLVKKWNPEFKTLVLASEPRNGLEPDVPEVYDLYASSESGFIMSVNGVPMAEAKVRVEDGEIVFGEDPVVHTGDAGRVNADGTITITGRFDEMVKIAGNRVDPSEVERAVRGMPGVDEVCARGFSDEDGAFLILFYVGKNAHAPDDRAPNPTAEDFENAILAKLPKYMLPLAAVRLEKFPHLPNGKVDKRSLSEVARKDIAFLSVEGDSIGRTESMIRISRLFGAGKEVKKVDAAETASVRQQEDYPLLPGQLTFFRLAERFPETAKMPIPLTIRFDPAKFPADRLRAAAETVFNHHPAIKTRFRVKNGEVRQFVDDSMSFAVGIGETDEATIEALLDKECCDFSRSDERLFHARLFTTEKANYLFFVAHHTLIDGYSEVWMIHEIVRMTLSGERPPEDRYREYLAKEFSGERLAIRQADEKFFRENYHGIGMTFALPFDFKSEGNPCEQVTQPFDGATPFETLAASAFKSLARHTPDGGDILVCWTFHGRRGDDESNIVGCLYKDLPILVNRRTLEDDKALAETIRRQMKEGVQHASMSYVEPVGEGGYWKSSPLMLTDQRAFSLSGDDWKVLLRDYGDYDFSVDAMGIEIMGGDEPHLEGYYNSALYKEETIGKFLEEIT